MAHNLSRSIIRPLHNEEHPSWISLAAPQSHWCNATWSLMRTWSLKLYSGFILIILTNVIIIIIIITVITVIVKLTDLLRIPLRLYPDRTCNTFGLLHGKTLSSSSFSLSFCFYIIIIIIIDMNIKINVRRPENRQTFSLWISFTVSREQSITDNKSTTASVLIT